MIPVSRLRTMPASEIQELFAPMFSYTLVEAPIQERETLVDLICDALTEDAATPRSKPRTAGSDR
ncbi:MAG: hypothetical protein QF926_01555 [Alphaproteobacteria bacterium]|jgi:hypothetical protein|nr:hypothetical protein [Alphaproteobacteria bacterium]MDP6515294.1 hypothetical protein [Alphaproteobacteria bacterium]|tara:strand:+ start:98 stop:292 length:195 start_codon:yes stop_codon:yes gene_type:complete